MTGKPHPPQARWTTADHRLILRESDNGLTVRQIWAKHFPDRPQSSVEKWLTQMRKDRKRTGYESAIWTPAEEDILRAAVAQRMPYREISARRLPGRSPRAIKCRAHVLGIAIRPEAVGRTAHHGPARARGGLSPEALGSLALLRALIRYAVRHHPDSDLARLVV